MSNQNDLFLIKAFNQNGVLTRQEWMEDVVSADGLAAGWHVHHGCDTWVNDVQIFSHLKPNERLIPGVID